MRLLTISATLVAIAQAHYYFPLLVVDGVQDQYEFSNVRETRDWQGANYILDVTSPNFRCNQAKPGVGNRTVPAGSTLGFRVNPAIAHPGPLQFYMARVPDKENVNTWEAEGNVWFKTGSIVATGTEGYDWLGIHDPDWPAMRKGTVSFKVPKSIPNGYYLVRVESLAIQNGYAQIYLGCGQILITGGGSGVPGPLVAFPGAYKPDDPGVHYSREGYDPNWKAPGPPVWQG